MSGFLALLVLAVLFSAGMAWLGWLVATAPEGFQDADGFHFGPPFIADERDGTDFQAIHDAGHRRPDGDGLAPALSFHKSGDKL